MSTFTVNPHRLDPYKVFKFQVILDGQVVPGVSRVGPLRRRTEAIQYRDGNFANHMVMAPGITTFEPIVVERGITHDKTFEAWAALAYNSPGLPGMSLKNFRKDVRINLLNEQGTIVRSYMIYRAWVSEYTVMPELDASASGVAIEMIVLTYEGFEIDESVTEPAET